ncbi:PAS domain S-box protein [Ideonella sp. BN130291]|uniref:PAS domain S-box protein n=1 Tax=Ideonella sp. BN130291 TaxID=3112940 RepID=UPI002E25D5A2|nr:PAS domain S-box protein [Ideonella sp. BN130291]
MAARPSAASPAASQDPHQQVRDLVARYFFGTVAVVSIGAAVVFGVLTPGLSALQRAALLLADLLLLGASLAAMRVPAQHLNRALIGVALLALAMLVLASSILQWGINSPSMGFFALITCLVGALAGRRAAAGVAGACAAALVGLALAEHAGWLAGASATLRMPVGVRLVGQGFVLAAGLAVGVLLSRVMARHTAAGAEREQRFLGLLWVAADSYWEMDAHFNIVAMWEQRPGSRGFVPVRGALGVPPWELPHVQFDEEALDAHRADLEARRPFRDLHVRWISRDGELRHMLVSGEPRFDARGLFSGYWGVSRDATQEVRAHDALAATERRYRELVSRIPTPLVLHREGRVIDANPAAAELFGYVDVAAMHGVDILRLYEAGDDRDHARERLHRLEAMPVGSGLPAKESRLLTPDGRRLVVRATGVRVQAEGGPACLSMFLDDTERKTAEEAVRRSEALLSHLVATSPDVITLTDLQSGRYAMVNDTFCRLTGYAAAEVIGRTSSELNVWTHPEERTRLVALLRDSGTAQNMPATFNRKDGSSLSLLVSAARFDMDGRDYLVINARDVTESERTRKEHEAILQNASIGIAFTRDRRFVQANAACEQMFGWPRGGLIGQPGSVVWPSLTDYEALGRELGPVLAAGQQAEAERLMCRRDGSTFLCRILAKAVDPAQPRVGGTIWILDDVTEQRLTDQALAKARDDAEAASRAKSAFLANTSHELRTPLNGLVGLTRLARQPDIDEAQRRHYLEQISDSAETLSAIINDILDLSKIEAGKLHVETLAFDLHGLVQTLQRGYAMLADARGLQFSAEIGRDVPRHVMGDPVRVRQIVGNYLSNALKFTAQGSVRLVLRPVANGRVRFEVYDTGPGIEPAVQERLFQPFTQADQSTTRRFGGTGLGLSICQELASLMGGEVGVHSALGSGSCFWAELPLPATDAHEVRSGFGLLDTTGPLAGARVLLVEDNPVNMMIGVALLEQWGVKVTQATQGRDAIAAVEAAVANRQPFEAVLMDVQMPEMSGHEATRLLRKRHDARELPIIALTAAALVSERDEALAAGMNDFLTKPIDAQRLRRTLLSVLARKGVSM